MVTVNGKQEKNLAGKSVAAFLSDRKAPIDNLVVELNGKIVHRASFDQVFLRENDKVEVISFVGGG
ncbi:sulfur carrier protein ThiS [Lactobacillus sp. ESL0791]|uniref:sulfur carrier protein ThiS n=1 Tax=Lactobacillus sp. ESL0791 TaxID=2983234 RepID=UPI0023F6D2D0|nr:sulfur carrier protein ThiS [Lactobacillus sp. ESL0791]MDF7637947.1 sulfur carrier protein ThiS [Lactobacillus sp. ESL0791]